MSCGIVLWPDEDASYAIKQLWEELSAHGIPTLATHTHRLHRPHVSLSVAESLPVQDALDLAGTVPPDGSGCSRNLPASSRRGTYSSPAVAGQDLLAEQRRVHQSLIPVASNPWPHFAADEWTPHITTGWALRPSQIAAALPRVLDRLPIRGWLDHGGVEDGDSGQCWPCPRPRPHPH